MSKHKPVIEMINSLGSVTAALLILVAVALAKEGVEGIWMVAAAFGELALLVGAVVLAYRYWQRRSGRTRLEIAASDELKAKRKLGDDGELIFVAREPGTQLFTFQGKGNQVMDQPVYLTASLYLLKYDCPPGIAGPASTSSPTLMVEMVDVEQDRIMPVMGVAGKGSQSFSVETEGRYVFQVTCHAARDKKWRIECSQL